MKLITQWNLRAIALSLVQMILSSTGFVMALALIQIMKWQTFSSGIYNHEEHLALMLSASSRWFFFKTKLLPLLLLFIPSVILDYFIIMPITEKMFE